MRILQFGKDDIGIAKELLDAFNIQPNSTHYAYYADIGLQESWGSDYKDVEHGGYIDAVVELVIDGEIEYLVTQGINDEGKKYLEEHVKNAVLNVNYYFSSTYTLNIEYVLDRGSNNECNFDINIELAGDFTLKSGYISYEDSDNNNKNMTMLILKYA